MRPIALATFFATFCISATAHGAPANLADFADAWGKGTVTHWPPPAAPPAGATPVPPALQPGGDPTLASEQPPPATHPNAEQSMQQTGQLPEGRLREADDADQEENPDANALPTNANDATAAPPPTGENANPPASLRPGVGSVNPKAKELWQFSPPKAK